MALANLRRHHIRLYSTFVFGYDHDTPESFERALAFAERHRMYMAAFNHLTPFPGTPLYDRLEADGQLLYEAWWRDPRYRYNMIPFRPRSMSPGELQERCLRTRERFYSLRSIGRRFLDPVNRSDAFMARNFPMINLMMRREVHQRDLLPLGDAAFEGALLPARDSVRAPAR